jgi:nicotinate dehydrogenase subunit A
MATSIELSINGQGRAIETDPDRSLLSVLREEFALTGAKYGCGEGQCGACTVLIDGEAKRSCVTKVGDCAGKQVGTIEGLAQDGRLHPLQAAFLECDASQCGYCTPGMILAGVALLADKPEPTPDDITRGLNGNICRCGTYARVAEAIVLAAKGGVK